MKKVLVVVDMQYDFIDGALGTAEAQAIVPAVKAKIDQARSNGDIVLFTRDTHGKNYLETQEGKKLPFIHCQKDSHGWEIEASLFFEQALVFDKSTFASLDLIHYLVATPCSEVEFVGVCTDICVVSNALLLKAYLPEMEISVDPTCCAGVTPESHLHALETMKMCQITVK